MIFLPQRFWGNHSGIHRIQEIVGDTARQTERGYCKAFNRRIKTLTFILCRRMENISVEEWSAVVNTAMIICLRTLSVMPFIFRNPPPLFWL